MIPSTSSPPPFERLAIHLQGIVQGVGFRPFVLREAQRLELTGWVRNTPDGVEIEAQGTAHALRQLVKQLPTHCPAAAHVEALQTHVLPPHEEHGFYILRSARTEHPSSAAGSKLARGTSARVVLPADLATCEACLSEVLDPSSRRYGYPFTACTQCGPRYSILERLPYDRATTTLQRFPLCDACRAEHDDVWDRRCHAQALACAACGPQLRLCTLPGPSSAGELHAVASSTAALERAIQLLREGGILALKGLGGFSLLVDALNPAAVGRLRQRKRRGAQPLACLASSLREVERWCLVDAEAQRLLVSPAAPIVLLPERSSSYGFSSTETIASPDPTSSTPRDALGSIVAPGMASVGFMLPSTALHHLLLQAFDGPLVCTSGNHHGEPICIDDATAAARLGPIADALLTHDRPIARPLDDSVVRRARGVTIMVRRARGYVPEAVELPVAVPATLALGAHQKSTLCIAHGRRAWISQHLGELDDPRTLDLLRRTVHDTLHLLDVEVSRIACDMHPSYASSELARELASRWGLPLIPVQHHHAHVVACSADALQTCSLRSTPPLSTVTSPGAGRGDSKPDPKALLRISSNPPGLPLRTGLAWDGVGLGQDGTLWGGEALRFHGQGFERVSTLRPIPLPGGDAAARDPRRVALALCWSALGPDAAREIASAWFRADELRVLGRMLEGGTHCPTTSSVGRLFDGISALAGACEHVQSFEGEAPMRLEALLPPGRDGSWQAQATGESKASPAQPSGEPSHGYVWARRTEDVLDWGPIVAAVARDRKHGLAPAEISLRFHEAMAAAATHQARRGQTSEIALSGGCFNNAWLAATVTQRLEAEGYRVLRHRSLPCGDGGISLGQALLAGLAEPRAAGTTQG